MAHHYMLKQGGDVVVGKCWKCKDARAFANCNTMMNMDGQPSIRYRQALEVVSIVNAEVDGRRSLTCVDETYSVWRSGSWYSYSVC